MKKFLSIVLSVISMHVFAQTNPITSINITLPANPDANITNWGTGTSVFLIMASTPAGAGKIDPLIEESKILVTIKRDGKTVCGAYTSSTAPEADFSTFTKVWSGKSAASLIGQDCVLPPGDYELSVQFFGQGAAGPITLSDEKIKPFTIRGNDQQAYQPPQAIAPADGTLFSATAITQPITFRWTPVVPAPQETVIYHLVVWQLMQGQTGPQAIKANSPILTKDVDNITQAVVTNLVTGPCFPPYLCNFVWNVRAQDKDGKPIGGNNGTSGTNAFNTTNPDSTTGHGNLRSMSVGCATTSVKHYGAGDVIALSDDFKMTFTAAPTGTDDSLSGTGTVKVKWLGLLNVKFSGIKINSDDALCSGDIYTNSDPSQVYPTQWAVNVLNNTSAGSWTASKIKAVSDGIQANKNLKPLVPATTQATSTVSTNAINMPLGYFKSNDSTNAIGFTEMIFKPDHAEFEAIASLNTSGIFKNTGNTFNGTDAISLQGSGIHFTNDGLSSISGTIKLAQPVTFTYANTNTDNLKLTFNTDTTGHVGNSITFSGDSTDWKYNFDADVQLPKQWLTPVDTTKTNVALNFQATISTWDDYILQANLPACTLPHAKGLGIEAGTIAYDHSTSANVDSMAFPDGYDSDTTEMFTGFYLKNFKLTLPDELRSYADTTKDIEIGAENLIIDKDGVSGKIYANNVLNYPKANVGNLGASIDTVNVNLVKNVLTQAKMIGKITLPLSTADNSGNALDYSALFVPGSSSNAADTSSISFQLKPAQDITATFLGDGKLQIDQTSTMNLNLSKVNNQRSIAFNIDLNGKLSYAGGKIKDIGNLPPLDLDLSCTFQHIGLTYKKTGQETFTFNPGQWSFASPQKSLCGFAFTITNVVPKIEAASGSAEKQYLFKGGVEFVASINIGTENSPIQISGQTKLDLMGAIASNKYAPPGGNSGQQLLTLGSNLSTTANNARTDYGFLSELQPVYLGVNVESINIDTQMPAAYIKGTVLFYKHDHTYGNGFMGEIVAKFTTIELGVEAQAIFGNTAYIPGNTSPGFKYWMVQAQVNLPPPGIPFLPGIAFRGFGAGVYSHMNMTLPTTFDPTQASSSTFGGATFTPDATVSIGFKVKAIVATTPKEETFNGSVGLGAEFNTSGGINFIDFDGQFYLGSKIGQETTAFANGMVTVRYDFPHKLFDMKTYLNMNNDVVETPSPIYAHFFIDGIHNLWAFTCGVPDTLNNIRLLNTFNVSEYLMFGNDIPAPHGFMPATLAGLHSAGLNPTFGQTAISGESNSAKGFAFGVGVNFSGNGHFDGFSASCWTGSGDLTGGVQWSYNVGGEFDASLLQYDPTVCPGLGHTGWRMETSIALYANASVQAYYHRCTGATGTINLLSISGGAYAYAEFPNPFYAEGAIAANVSILKGLISFSYSASFKTGTPCYGSAISTTGATAYTQQNVADSINYSLIKSIVTPGTSGVSRATDFGVLLNYPYNTPFDLQEQQSSGQVNIRTFRVLYTATLTKDSVSNTYTEYNGAVAHAALVTGSNLTIKTTAAQIGNIVAAQPALVASNTPVTVQNGSTIANHAVVAQTAAINPAAMMAIDNTVDLVDGNYDALGAKIFKQANLVGTNPANMNANALKANTSYRFEITAALQENVDNVWQPVNRQNTSTPVTQDMKLYFKTNTATLGVIVAASGIQGSILTPLHTP